MRARPDDGRARGAVRPRPRPRRLAGDGRPGARGRAAPVGRVPRDRGRAARGGRGRTADAVVCYLVLQHLPSVGHVLGYLREFGRVLAPAGEAFVQLPVLDRGLVPRAWRAARTIALPLARRGADRSAAFRGTRVTDGRARAGLSEAGLRVSRARHGAGRAVPVRDGRVPPPRPRLMADALALLVYLPALAVGLVVVWRRPVLALYAFVVGLAFHNLVMALLYGAGVTGLALDAIQAWKELLLAAALGRVAVDAVRARALPFRPGLVDLLALAFAGWSSSTADPAGRAGRGGGGERDPPLRSSRARACGRVRARTLARARRRGVPPARVDDPRHGRRSGGDRPGRGVHRLGRDVARRRRPGVLPRRARLRVPRPRRMPENFAFNSGGGELHRRLVGTFVSPLASAFLFAVALLLAAAAGFLRTRLGALLAAVTFLGLLFTISRSTVLALAGGLVVLAAIQRRAWPVAAAAGVVAAGLLFTAGFQELALRDALPPGRAGRAGADRARAGRRRGRSDLAERALHP